MVDLKHVLNLPAYINKGIIYKLSGWLFTPKPRVIQFPVCDRCNSRCIMCHRWQKDSRNEISIEKIREIFSSDLFSKVEDVNLHGGEPTLRKDLSDICKIVQDACPKIKRLWISTNGLGSKRIEKRIREILEVLNFEKVNSLEINVSIDGLEATHEKIRGIKGGFKQSINTIRMLKELSKKHPISVSIGTVIQPLNLHELDELEKLSESLETPINFQPLMFDQFFNIDEDANLKFSKEAFREFNRIIENKFAKGDSATSFYWCDFLSMMSGLNRKSPCAFDRYVFSLYPTGEVLPCSQEDWIVFGNIYERTVDKIWFSKKSKDVRQRMRREVCPTCSSYCSAEFSLKEEFFTYAKFYIKKQFRGSGERFLS